jgi:trehalose 6-phosphate synthase/phosphatase
MAAKRDGGGRTIIVSNRLPVHAIASNGKLELKPSTGGLVRGLEGVHGAGRSMWVGALGMPSGDQRLSEADTEGLESEGFVVVDVPPDLYELYYEGFSNDAIWPLFHYTPERCHFSAKAWEAYRKVNAAFAETIHRHVEPGDRVWIQDYQLMLVPDLLRRKRRDLSIGFFLHIPFPSAEVFRILPWRREILTGLLGADLIGFHTLEYMRHFSNAVARIMGIEPQLDTLNYGRRHVRLGAFPLGINTREIHGEARSAEAEQYLAQLHKLYQGRKVILGVDRLDYTKGIPERLAAFRSFLERRPEWVGNVSLVQVSVPSRVNVAEYQELKREVDEMVGMINGYLGSPGYIPIHYVFRNLDKAHLFALYRFAHVALVTPLRDGLNLVCKEYVAAKGTDPGVLVLSEFAGSAAEMGDAILVNPWNQDSMISGIETALGMREEEGVKMMTSISERLARYDNRAWSRRFLGALQEISEINHGGTFATLTEPNVEELSTRVANARRTFFFIDYDGTLVAIAEKPELAVPTEETLTLLRDMATIPTFHVHVVAAAIAAS